MNTAVLSTSEKSYRLICLAPLPPPVTGRTLATRRFLEKLSSFIKLDIVDLSTANFPGFRGRVLKFIRTMKAVARLAVYPGKSSTTLYLVANHDLGLIYDVLFILIARLHGYSLIIHHHVYSYLVRRKRLLAILIHFSPRDTIHLVLCSRMRDRFIELYNPRGSVQIMPNLPGRSSMTIKRSVAFEAEKPITIGFLSNITREKGIEDVLFLARRLCGSGRFRFIIAGPAGDPHIRIELNRVIAQFPDTFEWLGPVYENAKTLFYSSIDIFIFPTRYANEAQPLVLLEALSAGCCVVANDLGCIGETIDNRCGLVISDHSDFIEIAEQWLKKIVVDRSRLEDLSTAALNRASEQLSSAESAIAALAGQIAENSQNKTS